MTAIIGCFIFCHNENVRIENRMDAHITAINQRSDDLHREFYELLKEMRNNGQPK